MVKLFQPSMRMTVALPKWMLWIKFWKRIWFYPCWKFRLISVGLREYLKLVIGCIWDWCIPTYVSCCTSFSQSPTKVLWTFQILSEVGSVAYKLQLPKYTNLHPVFHVSYLTKHLGNTMQVTMPRPVITDFGISQDVPIVILDRIMVKEGILLQLKYWCNDRTIPRMMLHGSCIKNRSSSFLKLCNFEFDFCFLVSNCDMSIAFNYV